MVATISRVFEVHVPPMGGSCAEQDEQSRAHIACLVSPSRVGPLETHTFVFFFSICCSCCAAASHMALQVQYLWQSRNNSSRAVSSLL